MGDTTLAQLYARAAVQLGDASYRVYTTAALTEAIRQALSEYNATQGGTALVIKDLDSASATTFPKLHEGLLLIGACAFAVQTRTVDRADSFTDGKLPHDLQAFSTEQLKIFRQLLKELLPEARTKDLRGATVPPWSTTEGEQWLLPDE